MKNTSILFLVVWASLTICQAQNTALTYSTGQLAKENRYEDISGSPFLLDDWLSGDVLFNNGSLARLEKIKFDLVNQDVLYKEKDILYFFNKGLVKSFRLLSGADTISFVAFEVPYKKEKKTTFLQVFCQGDIGFYKGINKSILEKKIYGSANINKEIVASTKYYLLIRDNLTEVKLNKKAISDVLRKNGFEKYATTVDEVRSVNENEIAKALNSIY